MKKLVELLKKFKTSFADDNCIEVLEPRFRRDGHKSRFEILCKALSGCKLVTPGIKFGVRLVTKSKIREYYYGSIYFTSD